MRGGNKNNRKGATITAITKRKQIPETKEKKKKKKKRKTRIYHIFKRL